jgi:hypothetical protein
MLTTVSAFSAVEGTGAVVGAEATSAFFSIVSGK